MAQNFLLDLGVDFALRGLDLVRQQRAGFVGIVVVPALPTQEGAAACDRSQSVARSASGTATNLPAIPDVASRRDLP